MIETYEIGEGDSHVGVGSDFSILNVGSDD